jgi:hypothetical protein
MARTPGVSARMLMGTKIVAMAATVRSKQVLRGRLTAALFAEPERPHTSYAGPFSRHRPSVGTSLHVHTHLSEASYDHARTLSHRLRADLRNPAGRRASRTGPAESESA